MAVELPASVAFLLDEFRGKVLTYKKVQKRFEDSGFLRDLSDQCLHSLGKFDYADRQPPPKKASMFQIFAAGGLDPFSEEAKCSQPPCRIAYAQHFARTACLYSDRVIVPDGFSWGAFAYSPDTAFVNLAVLKTLLPLFQQGIVVFSSPAYSQCGACAKAAAAARRKLTTDLWREFVRTADVFSFQYGRQWRLSFGSPLLAADGEQARLTVPASRSARAGLAVNEPVTGKEAARRARQFSERLRPYVKSIATNLVFEARMGSFCRATVVTNSGLGAAGFRFLDNRRFDITSSSERTALRALRLPEFEGLSVNDVMDLRERAHKALPAFRSRMQRELFSLTDVSNNAEEAAAKKVAAELREEASELEAQLASITLPGAKRRERLFASLGVLLEIVALSTGNPALMIAAGGTFASLLLAAHKSQSDREEKHEVLVHQPAYVLLTAKRAHARHRLNT